MKIHRVGPLRVRAFGGSDREGGGDGPTIVLCHGFGAPGDDLAPLARIIDAGSSTRWLFPEGPLELEPGFSEGGRAWWPIDLAALAQRREKEDTSAYDTTPPGLVEAREQLAACIDELVLHHGVDPARLVIGGFSQGAMITTEIALTRRPVVSGLVALSGAVFSRERLAGEAARIGPELHVLQSHGRADQVISFERAAALHRLLSEAKVHTEFLPFSGGHEIPRAMLERIGAFARGRFAGPESSG